MARSARTEPSLTEWAVLGLLRDGPAHGWDVARAFVPDGEIGRVWTVSRPLVYRAITRASRARLRRRPWQQRRAPPVHSGCCSRRRRGAGRRSGAGSRGPIEHVRDLRSELLIKLLLLERSGTDETPLLRAQLELLDRGEHALAARVGETEGFDRTVAVWRLSTARAARVVRRGAARRASRRADQLRGDRVRPLGPHLARRHAAAAGGRRVGPVPDRAHRASSRRPPGSGGLLPRLGPRPPARIGRLGGDRRPVPRRPAARHVRPPLAAPAEPDLALALHRSSRSSRTGSSSTGSTCSTARPCST